MQPRGTPQVLHVDNRAAFWDGMSRHYRSKYQTLQAHPAFECVDVSTPPAQLTKPFDILMVGITGHPLHSLYPSQAFLPDELLEKARVACIMLEDMHEHTFVGGLEAMCSYIDAYYDYVVVTYDTGELRSIQKRCPNVRRFYVLPHFFDSEVFRDYGLPKVWDLIVYGQMAVWKYPFRNRLRRIARESSLSVKIVDHPGYEHYDPERCEEALARLINQSYLGIATPSTSDYWLMKYFEMAACRCVVAGKMASAGRRLWERDFVELSEEMSDEEILGRLHGALKDRDGLQEMAARMHSKVQREHSLAKYVEALEKILFEIHEEAAAGTRRARRTTGTQ